MSALAHRVAAKFFPGSEATQAPTLSPGLSREERLIFSVYVSAAALVTVFLAVTLTLWLAA
jgi:hypothetical protein